MSDSKASAGVGETRERYRRLAEEYCTEAYSDTLTTLLRAEQMRKDQSLAEALFKTLEGKGLLLKDYYEYFSHYDESKEININMSLKGLKPIVLEEDFFFFIGGDLKVGVLISESSGEVVAIFATKIEGGLIVNRKKVTYVAGLRPMKVEVVTIQKEIYYEKVGESYQQKVEEKRMEEVVDLPLLPIKAIKIIREIAESRKKDLETELKEKKKRISKVKQKQESLQLINIINICNDVLRRLGELEAEMKAEKAQELEKLTGMSAQMFYPKKLVSEAEKRKLIESTIAFLIQTLKGVFEDLEEWLSPQGCEGTAQRNERAETGMRCIGSILDLHIHVVYEAVESDKGLTVTATARPIRVTGSDKEQ